VGYIRDIDKSTYPYSAGRTWLPEVGGLSHVTPPPSVMEHYNVELRAHPRWSSRGVGTNGRDSKRIVWLAVEVHVEHLHTQILAHGVSEDVVPDVPLRLPRAEVRVLRVRTYVCSSNTGLDSSRLAT